MFRSSNPTLNEKAFTQNRSFGLEDSMTIQGTINKTLALFALMLVTASWVWGKAFTAQPVLSDFETGNQAAAIVGPMMMVGGIGGFILALVTIFKTQWAKVTAPLYALLEGLFIGGISAYFEQAYPGIVVPAVSLTFATLFCMLMAYKSGMIRATERFKLGIVTATGAICLVYFVSFIMSFFGGSIPLIHGSSTFGIGFSLVVVTIAALNLIIDFDFIEKGSQMGAPKYMEWYGAFALMVTLVWLYLEMLRLLAKLRSRR